MTKSIWADKDICQERRLVKKLWYIRNGNDLEGTKNQFEKPIIHLLIAEKKKTVTYGPVVDVGFSPYNVGKGSKMVEKIAMLFLCIEGNDSFVSIIVDEEQFDTKHCVQLWEPMQ